MIKLKKTTHATPKEENEMLYTVHTSYRAFDIKAGRVQNFCQTDRVDCSDKEAAKTYCRQRILDENKGGCTIVSQSARASSRK